MDRLSKNGASAIKEGERCGRRNKIKFNSFGELELFTGGGPGGTLEEGGKDCWNSEHEGAHEEDGQSSNLGRRFSSRGRKEGGWGWRETIEASSWRPVVDVEVSI